MEMKWKASMCIRPKPPHRRTHERYNMRVYMNLTRTQQSQYYVNASRTRKRKTKQVNATMQLTN